MVSARGTRKAFLRSENDIWKFVASLYYFRAKCAKNNKYYNSKIYKQYFIKTFKEVPEKPRGNPRTIVQSSVEKMFQWCFIILTRNLLKKLKTTNRKFMTNIEWKSIRIVPGKPSEGPKTITAFWWKIIFNQDSSFSREIFFSASRNFPALVLDTMTSPGAHTLQNLFNF